MKDVLKKVGQILLFIILLPILLLCLAGLLIYTPFDYVKYKKSRYYKDFGRKYRWLFSNSNCFMIYNSVMENGLPIEYVEERESNFGQGYFFYRDVLIIYDDVPVFDEKESCWTVSREGEEDNKYINISDAIQGDVEEFNSCFTDVSLSRGVILCDLSEIESEDISHIDECGYIITYENDPAEALRKIVERINS
ncbi:MAG: hypothetical protein J6L83_04000 [Clostridia bacterium]|nr:hypothetical protein [Clostridia bacterium]